MRDFGFLAIACSKEEEGQWKKFWADGREGSKKVGRASELGAVYLRVKGISEVDGGFKSCCGQRGLRG